MVERATVGLGLEPDQTEEILRRYAAIVEQSEDAIIAKTLEGVVTSWNPAAEQLYGYTAEEMIGRSLAVLVPPEQPDQLPKLMARVRRGERVEHFETERIRKDGERIHVSVSISPIRDNHGTIVGASSIKRDVTDRIRAAAERDQLLAAAQAARELAESAVQARDEFLVVAAHELKTPVTSLRGYSQLLMRQLDRGVDLDASHLRRALAVIDGQSERLARLVGQLLDVSRLEMGRLRLEREWIDLSELVERAAAAAQLKTDRHELVVRTPVSAEARVDSLRFEQVIVNLLDNAVKYSPDGGAIEIGLERQPEATFRLSVRDHGVGILPERREWLFHRFFRADPEGAVAGLGIGLYLCRQIVELHGGTIDVEFPDDGGSRFVVVIPRDAPEPPDTL